MQYLGKIKTELGLEMIFMCANNPGLCDEWDAEGGGNTVLIVEGFDLEFFQPADPALSLRETEYGVKLIKMKSDDYEDACEDWAGENREILGQLFGNPYWLQADETPVCDLCKKPMRFVAHLEQGPDYKTEMNFGGGMAYLFDCLHDKTAKFLWQC